MPLAELLQQGALDTGLVRALILVLPMATTIALMMVRRPSGRVLTGMLLAVAWQLPPLLVLNALAPELGWWRFDATGGLWLGVPVELLISWAFMWGALPAMLPARVHPAWIAAGALLLDLLVIPLARPLIDLHGARWLLGEVLCLVTALMPGLVLARWTAGQRNLVGRAVLQAIGFGGLVLIVLPAAILAASGQTWDPLLSRPLWQLGVAGQLVGVLLGFGVRAAQELALHGDGTPLPQDPTTRLVVSGPYAYVANPMQLTTALVFALMGLLLESWPVAGAGAMVFVFSAGLASWHERLTLTERFGAPYTTWRSQVRAWLPRWRPWVPFAATLYYAEGCAPCEAVARWVRRRGPIGLVLVPAQQHPDRELTRLTWRSGDGSEAEEEGVAAFARALGHIHLGWAMCAWLLRLPGIMELVQLFVDASGGGPRPVPRDPDLTS